VRGKQQNKTFLNSSGIQQAEPHEAIETDDFLAGCLDMLAEPHEAQSGPDEASHQQADAHEAQSLAPLTVAAEALAPLTVAAEALAPLTVAAEALAPLTVAAEALAPLTVAAEATHDDSSPARASAIDPQLRHVDAVKVFDSKGNFKHWAPLTMQGLCGHPCRDGKLCNNNVGNCRVHQRSELARMAEEDDAACIIDRGHCGVEQRNGEFCLRPRTRCSIHAAERERCHSMVDNDPTERCMLHRAPDSLYCVKHADYPDYSVVVKQWVTSRHQWDEQEFMAHIRDKYPLATFPQHKCHDFQKYVGHFAQCAAASHSAQ